MSDQAERDRRWELVKELVNARRWQGMDVYEAAEGSYDVGYDDGASDERAAIVEWLRKPGMEVTNRYADAITAGAHRGKP